jgi:2-polyprenyl-3-methyl-5-hydroxy-6-metoxy-1,4-benzoquinol methylase
MSGMLKNSYCTVCEQPGKLFYSLKRLDRVVYRCPNCGFKWTCPPLHYDNSETTFYYESPPYQRCMHSDEKKARIHMANLLNAVDLNEAPSKLLLEVGCSNGSLLTLLAESGFTVEGLEISRLELEECRRKKLNVHAETFENFQSERQFGVILSAHVIEHLSDVHQYFHSAGKMLSPGGLNIFLTPNGGSALFFLFRRFWSPATPDEHNLFLTFKSVKILAEKHGYDVVNITNTDRYFSTLRGFFSELNRIRQSKAKKDQNSPHNCQPVLPAQVSRTKRELLLKLIGYFERPVLYPLHYLLTRMGLSDELLCVLKKRE